MHEQVEHDGATEAPPERAVADRSSAPAVPATRARTGSRLVVGAVDDPAERTADAMADAVLAQLRHADRAGASARVQRKAVTAASAVGRTEGEVQRSATTSRATASARIQRKANVTSAATDTRPLRLVHRSAIAIRREDTERVTDPEADPDGEDVGMSEEEAAGTATDDGADEVGGDEKVTRSESRVRRSTMDGGAPGHGAAGGPVDPATERLLRQSRGGGTALDDTTRSRMERGFGSDLSGVKIHVGSSADTLNRSLNARAFTVGSDIFFGKGEYRPGAKFAERLLAHELAHVVGDSDGPRRSVRRTQTVIRRRFAPAVTASKSHLRQINQWGQFHGPAIAQNTRLLVDNSDENAVVQHRSVLPRVTWRPAINITPETHGAVANNLQGYIRSTRARFAPTTLERTYRREISRILATAETRVPGGRLTDKLVKDDHLDFLVEKALRYGTWNPDKPTISGFTMGLATKQAKLDRIQQGAEHVADSLEHWRKWLHPTQSDSVRIIKVKFLKSDLHEHGLGVLDVEFKKPLGGAAKFSTDKTVKTIIKPEDKRLEKELLGSDATSAASQINQLAGLDASQSIGTVKMEVEDIGALGAPVFTTLVEKINGVSSEDLVGGNKDLKSKGTFATQPSFHETLVFAFLAGIDDLHWENVMWVNNKPYLIDADTVMTHGQMTKTGPGDFNQSGFSTFNKDEATTNKEAIKSDDPVRARSRILDMMVNNPGVRAQIIAALRGAITGRKGRTVPISTARWGIILNSYQTEQNKDGFLDFYSSRAFLARENKPFDAGFGAGLASTTGVNVANDFYSQATERAQLKADLDAGQLPFYEYEYNTGFVTHNGQKVFHGMTLGQAMTALAARY